MRLWHNFTAFLGPTRLNAIFLLLAGTGLGSLMLNAAKGDWVVGAQTLLLLLFIGGATGIIFSALDPFNRGRWLGILTPAFILVVIGTLVVPAQGALFMGLAFGWIIAAQFVFNPRAPMAYQKSIKAMRTGDYDTALTELDGLIRKEPKNAAHYQFRAEVYRLAGRLPSAKRDYKKLIDLGPEYRAVGYNLLAELHLQAGEYQDALTAGRKALELAPEEWVAAYNLGMIEDRLNLPAEALSHLDHALEIGVPDARHRLLIQFYRARAFIRLGDTAQATAAVAPLTDERKSLKEWRKLLESEQAAALRQVLQPDIDAAEALIAGQIDVTALG